MLASQAAGGSKESFCSLYGLYKDKLYRYAVYRLGDPHEAEDAVSECVLAAWQRIGQLRKPDAFGAWIFRILHNVCAGYIAGSIRHRDSLQSIYESDADSSSAASWQGSQTQLSIELQDALAQLTDDERTAVLLSVIGGLNSNEISRITGAAPGSVRSRLSRGLAKMRAYLGNGEDNE